MIRLFTTILCVMLVCGCCNTHRTNVAAEKLTNAQPDDVASNAQLLDKVLADPVVNAWIDHSEVKFDSPAIAAAVRVGPSILPAAIERMKSADITVDGLLKLFTVCDQILRVATGIRCYYAYGLVGFDEHGKLHGETKNEAENLETAKDILTPSIEWSYKNYLAQSHTSGQSTGSP